MKRNTEQKAPKIRRTYRGTAGFAKLAAPVFNLLYYVFIALLFFFGILALIITFVNTSVEDMLLPPLMTVHGTDYYSIFIGNGIRIDTAYAEVTLADIKTVIYAETLMAAAVCCMMAPVSLFLSKLLSNVAKGQEYELKNARYMQYIALSVMIGYTFLLAASRFYNYLLVKNFVPDGESIHLSMGLDLGGILVGALIFLLAAVYGHTCEEHLRNQPVNAENVSGGETQNAVVPTKEK